VTWEATRPSPYDGHHPLIDDGSDWRSGNSLMDIAERFVSYGNYAGPGDRAPADPIDGVDAAAQRHDDAYTRDLGDAGYFSWQGMKNVHADDARLVADVGSEMGGNGAKYAPSAVEYSEGLRGFFGGRAAGMDAVEWAGAKVGEAEQGLAGLAGEAESWRSLSDAGHGIAAEVAGAGRWLGETTGQAWHGAAGAGEGFGSLGLPGVAGAAIGLGNVAAAGAGHVASEASGGARSLGESVASGAAHVWSWLTG